MMDNVLKHRPLSLIHYNNMQYLKYDPGNMFSPRVTNKLGATRQQLKRLDSRLGRAHRKLYRLRKTEEQGFMDLPYDIKTAGMVERLAAQVQADFDNLIVIGIGGSDLGARAINRALVPLSQYGTACRGGKLAPRKKGQGVRLFFAGANTDPDTLVELLEHLDLRRTAINVISKSGSTMETMSAFFVIREALIKKVGKNKHRAHVFATTDITGGILQTIAEDEGYTIIPHPLNVGGRFAVLSTVGLFPAACAGIEIRKILKGARSVEDEHRRLRHKSPVAQFAGLHYLAYEKKQQRIHVCMPYADSLKEFAFWYRQIWAESLGKDGLGPTPIASLGSTDQHSQIQLYNDGPADKVVTFIEVGQFRSDLVVPKSFTKIDQIKYFQGRKFKDLIHAERQGTAKALTKSGTPNGTLCIPKINPESLGALFMFYELATAYMGELWQINTYNQPGVETGKKLAKQILSRK